MKILPLMLFLGAVIAVLLLLLSFLLGNRRKLKKAMREIENFNQLRETFINADSNPTYLKDENLNYVFVNRAFLDFYEKTPEEIIGLDDFALSGPEFAERYRQTDLAVLREQTKISEDIVWHGCMYSVTRFPVKLPNGKYGVGAYIRNVTDERRQEQHQAKVFQRNKILIDALGLSFQSRQEQVDYVLHRALELTESKYGYLFYFDEETAEFTLNSWTNGAMAECHILNPQTKYDLDKTGLWGEVVRQRKPIIVNDFQRPNPLKRGYPEGHIAIENFMSAPIIMEEKIVMVIGLANKPTDYNGNDVANITILMCGVWQAVQRKAAQEQLAYERNRYLQTLISIGDGVLVVDRDGKIEMLNHVAQRLTGWTNEEAHGKEYKDVFVLSHEYPGHSITDPIESVFRTNTAQELENHAVLTARDGDRHFLEDNASPIINERNESTGVVLVFRDVTEKREQKNRIEYLSFHDTLTSLFNRRYFEEALMRTDTEGNLPISIVMGDINGLKLTNDVFGHTYGDMLLTGVSAVFRNNCRSNDIIARWGGDEFILLFPKTDLEETQKIVLRIKKEFSEKRIRGIRGSISMGICCKTDSSESMADVLSKAEENMYSEKTLERKALLDEWIGTIIDMLHTSNAREKEHAQNVSRMCEAMGRALGLPDGEIRKLKKAGYLHDIGKIVMEPEQLDETAPLSAEEKSKLRKHPVVGFRILNASEATLDFAEAVLAHHEHWDGSGYPKGLKGEEIPLFARIIAVAECYDRAAGRSGGSPEQQNQNAVAVLRSEAGKRFDPDIVAAFLLLPEPEAMR